MFQLSLNNKIHYYLILENNMNCCFELSDKEIEELTNATLEELEALTLLEV